MEHATSEHAARSFPARSLTRSIVDRHQKEKIEKREKPGKKEKKEKRKRDEAEPRQPEPSKVKDKKQRKNKRDEDAAPGVESHPIDVLEKEVDNGANGAEHEEYEEYEECEEGGGRQGTAAKAFQRVKADEWLNKKGSWDNSYVGTFGQAGWGFKAQQVLGQVRGKDFRHEKTKKKRGSYRGGLIDSNAVCSYKFDSDGE